MIWINGQITDDAKPHILSSDRGYMLGDGVFETLLAMEGVPIFFACHMERLFHAAALLDINIPYTAQEIRQATEDLLTAQGVRRANASIRITLSRGPGPRGLVPPPYDQQRATLLIMAAPFQGTFSMSSVVRFIISDVRRNEKSPTSRIKALGYLDNQLARGEALRVGAEEAVMRNTSGYVACASTANIFTICAAGRLVTPPLTAGSLPGIIRKKVIMLATQAKQPFCEENVSPEDLRNRLVFFTNSLQGLCQAQPVEGVQVVGQTAQRVFDALKEGLKKLAVDDKARYLLDL